MYVYKIAIRTNENFILKDTYCSLKKIDESILIDFLHQKWFDAQPNKKMYKVRLLTFSDEKEKYPKKVESLSCQKILTNLALNYANKYNCLN